MQDYSEDSWVTIFAHNGLKDFDALWNIRTAWFETPNQRRGGWSGVCQQTLAKPDGGCCSVFIKRQENHTSRTLFHPIRGMATYTLEMQNILRYQARDISVLVPIYYGQRWVDGNLRAVLVTEALAAYASLEQWLQTQRDHGKRNWQQWLGVMRAVADFIRNMHQHHLQHDSLYPKHIFLKIPAVELSQQTTSIDIRLIDLEKTKWRLFPMQASYRDLYTLHRRTKDVSRADRLRFLKFYLQVESLTPMARLVASMIDQRVRSRKHVGDAEHKEFGNN